MGNINVYNRNKNKPGRKPNWEYRFEAARINGKRKYEYKSGFSSKAEALEAGIKAYEEYVNSGKSFKPTELSVSDFCDYWVEHYAEMNLSYRSIKTYSHKLDKYLKPVLGHYFIKNIDTVTLQNLIDSLVETTQLSAVYIKSIVKVIKGLFHYAKSKKFIKEDPALDVDMPNIKDPQKDYHILTKEELTSVLERFKYSPYQYYAILTGYYTGLRVSEVYGLTWDCIDFENKTITVNKAVQRIETSESYKRRKSNKSEHIKTNWCFVDTKTSQSTRTIKIGNTLLDLLKYYKELQKKYQHEYNELYTDYLVKEEKGISKKKTIYRLIPMQRTLDFDFGIPKADLVFVKEDGRFDGTDSMKYVGKIARKDLKIDFHFHALRHGHATTLIENGAPIKDVTERLGHANTKITMDIYVNNTEKMKEASVNIFEDAATLSLSNPKIVKYEF